MKQNLLLKHRFLSYATDPQQVNACWGDFPGKSPPTKRKILDPAGWVHYRWVTVGLVVVVVVVNTINNKDRRMPGDQKQSLTAAKRGFMRPPPGTAAAATRPAPQPGLRSRGGKLSQPLGAERFLHTRHAAGPPVWSAECLPGMRWTSLGTSCSTMLASDYNTTFRWLTYLTALVPNFLKIEIHTPFQI